MAHCLVCAHDVVPTPPSHGHWALIVTFWALSLLFGMGAAAGTGWGLFLVLAWLLLAITTSVLVHHATSWTCPACGAELPQPVSAGSPPPPSSR